MLHSASEQVRIKSSVPKVPFELVNNHVLIDVQVNGGPKVKAVLDTGMPGPGLVLYKSPTTDALKLKFNPSFRAQVRGAGGNGKSLHAEVATSETLDFGSVSFEQSRVMVIPVPDNFPTYHHGIVGYSFFRNFVVEINVDRGELVLHPLGTYSPPEGANIVPLSIRQNMPHATLGLSLEPSKAWLDAEVVVDLGAGHAISLNDEEDGIFVPSPAIDTVLGHGLSGPILGKAARIAKLRLGDAVLSNVVTSFPVIEHQNPRGTEKLAGNLGTDVLRRFNVTFDYQGRRMVLEPNSQNSEPFEYDHSGVRLRFGDAFVVESVLAGSPAAEAGISEGDVLTHLNDQPVHELGINRVRAALETPGQVALQLRRNGAAIAKTVQLRRLL